MLLGLIQQLQLWLAVEKVVNGLVLGVRQVTRQVLAAASAPDAKNDLAVPQLGLLDSHVKVSQRFTVGKNCAAFDDVANLLEFIGDFDANLRHIGVFTCVGQITDSIHVQANCVGEFGLVQDLVLF